MPVKRYGIFVTYSPSASLRAEGLGRYLAAFLRAACKRSDVRFVVACPTWSRQQIVELCESEGIDPSRFDVMTPTRESIVLRLGSAFLRRRVTARGPSLAARVLDLARAWSSAYAGWLERQVARSRTGLVFLPLTAQCMILLAVALPISLCIGLARLLVSGVSMLGRYLLPASLARITATGQSMANSATRALSSRIYQLVLQHESELLISRINSRDDVAAWYAPTSFWPAFNDITRPRLMCVPDVVLSEFPYGFATLGGAPIVERFEELSKAIVGCPRLLTYSEHVKWTTLVDRFRIDPGAVSVVRHAPNRLDHWVTITGTNEAEATSRNYCESLLMAALRKSPNQTFTEGFLNKSVQFLFYPSQFRPSKNILTLLRAYEYLRHQRFIGHKLILTGSARDAPEVDEFIHKHNLENDVLCLQELTISELAACYKLADVAVNPSLSEGGCPFTFTEALSVGTPVVLARIPVTMEVLSDRSLDQLMFFDPYDWRDTASRIQFAIDNREELLRAQLPVYSELARRSWSDVVNEIITILDTTSEPSTSRRQTSASVATPATVEFGNPIERNPG